MRSLTRPSLYFLLTALLAFGSLSGCGGISGGRSDVTPPPGGHCANPLFPVSPLATWEYQGLNPVIGHYAISQQISSVGEQGFTLAVQYGSGVSAEIEWTCLGGDLTQLQAGNGPAGMMSSLGGTSGFAEMDKLRGVTLPGIITAGDTWQQSMDLGGEARLPTGVTGSSAGTYLAEFSAIGMELVTVPAGTFHAMRIEVQATYDLVVTVRETVLPYPFTTSMVLWYAPGVGLVRVENNNEATTYEIIELLSFNLP